MVAYPVIMGLALVYTAEHYVIDVVLAWCTPSSWTGSARRGRRATRRARRADDEPTRCLFRLNIFIRTLAYRAALTSHTRQ
jgi:hypothetical protein